MTFRIPLTSAQAVDTGQPAAAAARLYEGSDATGVFGVLEFRDGIAGDSPSQVIGRASLTPQGGGYTQQGGGLALKGGGYNGTAAPEIDLNVESLPTAGYGPKARLAGAPLGWEPLQLAIPAPGPGANPTGGGVLGPGWTNYDTTIWAPLTFWLLADGRVHFQGMLKNVLGSAIGSGSAIIAANTLPTWTRPRLTVPPQIMRCSVVSPATGHARVDVSPNGQFQLVETTIPNGEWIALVGTYRTDA